MLTPWKESYDQPRQHIKKQRHYFVNKGPSSQGHGFSSSYVQMWELDYKESWVPKNWCFWTVVLERLLRVPWTARRSSQSILREISPGYSLEGLMLKLKLQYFGHLMWKADSFEKTLYWERLRAGGEGDDRGWDGWMASPTRWTWVLVDSGSWWWTGRPDMLQFMGLQRVGHGWVTELNWTEPMIRGFSPESSDRADFSEKVLSKRQIEIAQVKWAEKEGCKDFCWGIGVWREEPCKKEGKELQCEWGREGSWEVGWNAQGVNGKDWDKPVKINK